MSELQPPRRWLDDAAGAPSSFAAAARGFREDVPTTQARERMWDALARTIAAPAASRAWRMPWRGIGALLLIGAGVMLAVQGAQPRVTTPPVAAEKSERVAPPAVAEAAPAAVELDSVAQPQPPPAALPKPKASVRASSEPQKPALVTQPTAADEVSLLVRARRLLHAQPERALALTDQHSAAHPRGVFAEERELLAIEALRQLGRHEQANQRIAKFLAEFPSSAHRRRIEALRGHE